MKLYVITGACGAGKSTMKDHVSKRLSNERYMAVDIDEVGLNWWDYAGSENESKYHEDALRRAVKMAEGKDLIFVSCMNQWIIFKT